MSKIRHHEVKVKQRIGLSASYSRFRMSPLTLRCGYAWLIPVACHFSMWMSGPKVPKAHFHTLSWVLAYKRPKLGLFGERSSWRQRKRFPWVETP